MAHHARDIKDVMPLYRVFLDKRVKINSCIRTGNEINIDVSVYDGNNNDDYTTFTVYLKPAHINVSWEIHVREWAHP